MSQLKDEIISIIGETLPQLRQIVIKKVDKKNGNKLIFVRYCFFYINNIPML